jgi:hypothetical protein
MRIFPDNYNASIEETILAMPVNWYIWRTNIGFGVNMGFNPAIKYLNKNDYQKYRDKYNEQA